MLFYIEWSCPCDNGREIIEASDIEVAADYARQRAIDSRESFEGYHGVMDFEQFCEVEDREIDDNSWEDYMVMVEDEINYFATAFDEANDEHLDALEEQGGCPYIA
jgi:hypothetical protein